VPEDATTHDAGALNAGGGSGDPTAAAAAAVVVVSDDDPTLPTVPPRRRRSSSRHRQCPVPAHSTPPAVDNQRQTAASKDSLHAVCITHAFSMSE